MRRSPRERKSVVDYVMEVAATTGGGNSRECRVEEGGAFEGRMWSARRASKQCGIENALDALPWLASEGRESGVDNKIGQGCWLAGEGRLRETRRRSNSVSRVVGV